MKAWGAGRKRRGPPVGKAGQECTLCGLRRSAPRHNRMDMQAYHPFEAKDAPVCPTCKGPLRDLRGTGFDPVAIEKEGTCYRWTETDFCCVKKAEAV